MNRELDIETRMASIGINIPSKEKNSYTDIEKTLCLACQNIEKKSRFLSLLLSWIFVHGERVNAERLKKISKTLPSPWISLLARYATSHGLSRWKILIEKPLSSPIANDDIQIIQSKINLKGEEIWAKNSGFLIPIDSEPISNKYILAPEQLAKINVHYKNKIIYGSNWRADMITAFQSGAENPFQCQKRSFSSYEPAYRIFMDFQTIGGIPQSYK
jgi:hypothetical protein